jgi:hypothetical protein
MWLPSHLSVLSREPEVQILWKRAFHGRDWTKCYCHDGTDIISM